MQHFHTSLAALALLTLPFAARAQSIGIGTPTPNAAAVLELQSTTKGLLLPRLTQAERNALGTGSIAPPWRGW